MFSLEEVVWAKRLFSKYEDVHAFKEFLRKRLCSVNPEVYGEVEKIIQMDKDVTPVIGCAGEPRPGQTNGWPVVARLLKLTSPTGYIRRIESATSPLHKIYI